MSRYYAEHGERYIVDYDGFRESDDKEVIKREIRTKQNVISRKAWRAGYGKTHEFSRYSDWKAWMRGEKVRVYSE